MSKITQSRQVEQIYRGQETSDGAGVKLTRLFSNNLQQRLDPFLMLDCFGSDNPDDYIAGFPNHPHRGFETVTYMIEGRMLHRDSKGNEGLLENGGVQWMTAGSGLIHSEIPQQEDGVMRGFQLWLNLAAKDKMITPWYQDFQANDLSKYTNDDGVAVTVIAGRSDGIEAALQRENTEPLYLDVHIPANQSFDAVIPTTHNAFIVVYEGKLEANGTEVVATQLALLSNAPEADGIRLKTGNESARVLVLAGKPLNEPIVQHGPFVMNSREEIMQAFNDFQAGLFA
ncbi:MAG: pirin family protein [Alcaligenaceae bacterium]|nr:pirin family protein [Alcaligenaceae bacterium]